jgi:MerR family transcriptional regulator/heat shock protein HspR
MMDEGQFQDEPCFVISVAARIVGLHAQTLRYYERVGLIWPSRSRGKQRLYSPADIQRLNRIKTFTEDMGLNRIKTFTEDMGLNLAGAEVALKLADRIEQLEAQVQDLSDELDRMRRTQGVGSQPRSANAPQDQPNTHQSR